MENLYYIGGIVSNILVLCLLFKYFNLFGVWYNAYTAGYEPQIITVPLYKHTTVSMTGWCYEFSVVPECIGWISVLLKMICVLIAIPLLSVFIMYTWIITVPLWFFIIHSTYKHNMSIDRTLDCSSTMIQIDQAWFSIDELLLTEKN